MIIQGRGRGGAFARVVETRRTTISDPPMIRYGSTTAVAGDDSHLLAVPAGNLGMPFASEAFAELRRVITNQHLSAGLGGGCAIGLTSPTLHKQPGNTLKTTRNATAKSSLQTMNIWVVEEDALGVLLGCSVVRTPRRAG